MASWRDIGESNRLAAVKLHADDRSARPSITRAYYAVFHELTHQLTAAGFHDFGKRNGGQRGCPTHATLAKLAKANIDGLSVHNRVELQKAVIRLRGRREAADYQPGTTVDKSAAKEAIRDMFYALRILSRAKGGI